MQLFLQNGTYAGKTFFQPATIQHFADCQFCVDNNNRRGIGFDKPQLGGAGPTCGCVSMLSFGHTGFTGTIAWVDPEEDIVYIFLSNRVHPDAENRKLITMGTRTAIQQTIYDALNSYHYE
jgi:CubicO group peptidase (beta-lactamase class C family)